MRNSNDYIIESAPKNDLSSYKFYTKVFGYFGLALLFTALFTFGFSYLFNYLWPISDPASAVTYTVLTVISSIGLFVTTFITTARSLKKGKGGLISGLLYVTFMSFLLSSISFYVGDSNIIGISVAVTSIIFTLMCVIGLLFKGRGSWFIAIAFSLMIGAGLIFLVNTFLLPLIYMGNETALNFYLSSYYAAEFLILIYAAIITIVDMISLKRFANNFQDDGSTNIALYFALNLYNDFILILLKIISIILRTRAASNNN